MQWHGTWYMRFNVFRRIDDALVVVPAGAPVPRALGRKGVMRVIGAAQVPLAHLSDRLVEDLARIGYAVAEGPDEALLRAKAGFATRLPATPGRDAGTVSA